MSRIYPSYQAKLKEAWQALEAIGFVSGDGPFNEAVSAARSAVVRCQALARLRDEQTDEYLAWHAAQLRSSGAVDA